MNLQFDIIAIESLLVEVLDPDFLHITYDLNYGNIQISVIVGDDRYKNVKKEDGISEILALINLTYPDFFNDYELNVQVFSNDDVINYIKVIKE